MTKQDEQLADLHRPDRPSVGEEPTQKSPGRRAALKKIGSGMVLGLGAAALMRGEQTAKAQTSLVHASWIHGHTGHVELPDAVGSLTPVGFHLEIDPVPNSFNWVHFGIPTPVILYDTRLRIQRVMLNFQTNSIDSWVANVHVWDGATRIATFNGLLLSGNHPFEAFDIPETPLVFFGIGISLGIAAGVEAFDHRFFFRTVGADFV